MGRRATPVGELGRINWTRLDRDRRGDGIARGRVKGSDNRLHAVEAYGTSKAKAEDALRARARQVAGLYAVEDITSATPLRVVVQKHLDDLERVGEQRPQTLTLYRFVLDDLQADRGGPGELLLRDCTRARIRGWLESIERDHPAKARRIRVVLNGAFDLAADADALGGKASPLHRYRMASRPAEPVRAATVSDVHDLRQRANDWADDVERDDDGNPVPTRRPGRARTRTILPLIDVLVATGARISEVLAIRAGDLNLDSSPATVSITGTLVPVGGSWERQPLTKSEAGHRTVAIPAWCVETLQAHLEVHPAKSGELVFRSEAGTPMSPSNVRRQWRAIRGEGRDWLTPRSLRKAVATIIAIDHGADAAAAQLGHAASTVTRRHYIARAAEAPDRTDVLDIFGKQSVG